jgi:PAS domain S-box-containing protein
MFVPEPILYIDDEPLNLESFKIQFEDIYQVYTAESAKEAYEILASNSIKVVISDQRMPEVTGIELLELVKQKYPDIIRILLTAYIQEEYLLEAINKGGVFRYLTKPWQFIELNTVIKSAIETYNLKLENKQLIEELKDKINLLIVSEEKFRNIFNSTSEGILIYDLNYTILNVNWTIEKMLKISADEIIGKQIINFFSKEQVEKIKLRIEDIKTFGNAELAEYKILTTDGVPIIFEAKSDFIQYEGQPAILSMLHDITEKRNFEKQLYIAQVNAEEKERERLAKELHDGIGPLLSTLKIYMHDIQSSTTRETQDTSISKSDEIINEVISCAKEISNNISPHVLRNFGLVQAIKGFIDRLIVRPDIQIHLKNNLTSRLDEIIEITLYRISTELLNNTIKYADANNVYIDIIKTENLINFNYKDDGKGFDYSSQQKDAKGLGLQNIQSRVLAIGGQFSYFSKYGAGVNVSISLTI